MNKYFALVLSLFAIVLMAFTAVSADDIVYGTAVLSYAEFYSGDVSSASTIDAVTSATNGKSGSFSNVNTDFVDAETNKDGYHLLGVKGVNVAVPANDVEAYKAINPSFEESDEVPAQYKPVEIVDGQAVYGSSVFNVADTVSDANIDVLTDTNWGDYQINILETSTGYLRNTRSDEGFAIGSGIQGIIVETASGLKVGMEHLQNIWIQPYEISWNVSVDNSHNTHIVYENFQNFDKLMGETVTRVTYINADDAYVYEFEGAYLPVKFVSSIAVDNAVSASGETAVTVTGLPDDYAEHYAVAGLNASVADGILNWSEDKPGAYTLVLTDENGIYAKMTAAFVLSTDVLPVIFNADEAAIVPADGESDAMAEAFLANLSRVTVNGAAYAASGRGAVVIIDKDGELDDEAAVTSGSGADAVVTPIFGESGDYEITVEAVGFNTPLTFVYTK